MPIEKYNQNHIYLLIRFVYVHPFPVCRATIDEMLKAIAKVDPRKKVEVSGFRMDSKNLKTVQLIRSETYLTELMETVCKYRFCFEIHVQIKQICS